MNGAVSKVNKKFISHLTRVQRAPSAAASVQVSHALPAVRFSCLLRGRGVSLQDGAAAGKGVFSKPYTKLTLHCNHRWTPQSGAHRKPFPAAAPSWKLAPRPRSKHEKRTAGSAGETWTVAAADGVRCARVR